MKPLLVGVAACTVLALALSDGASAQDPAVVNAKTIRVTLENDRVRVLEAVLQPGDKEQLHTHPAYVFYVIEGGRMRNHAIDGTTSDTELQAGQVFYRDPLTHWAENIGTTTVRVVLVELKGPTPSGGGEAMASAGHASLRPRPYAPGMTILSLEPTADLPLCPADFAPQTQVLRLTEVPDSEARVAETSPAPETCVLEAEFGW